MLKPIRYVSCSPALRACRRLQVQLMEWLCDPNVGAGDINRGNLVPPRVPTQIETNWVWRFLQKVDSGQSLLTRAITLATMSPTEKQLLQNWVNIVDSLENQFKANPPAWPAKPAISDSAWQAFRELMEAFYEKGLRSGLPYDANGTEVTNGGVNYAQFVKAFRDEHRLSPDPYAREICVLCGGVLDDIEVDHWIAKSAYPLLSVCVNNLLPICGKCNSTDNKGVKPVYSPIGFTDWFHPYLHPTNGRIYLDYDIQTLSITAVAVNPSDTEKVSNLDTLLNLGKRWTQEFKAEYLKQQKVLLRREKQRISNNNQRHTQAEILNHFQTVQADLLETEPNFEVHKTLLTGMMEPARLAAWKTELELVT